MSLHRHIPIHYDHQPRHYYGDPFDTYRDVFPHHRDNYREHSIPILRDGMRDPLRDSMSSMRVDPLRDARSWYTDAAYQQALQPVAPAMPLSRSFFNPERQLGTMDHDMSRMANEMKRMYTDVQHLMPVDANPESWRVKENFHLDNPVVHDASGKGVFRLQFDVRQFRPEEIHVKTAGNNLTVHAKHDEKGEGKELHREYNRQYVLPKDMSAENLISRLNKDGVLTIEAPLPAKHHQRDHMIPIKHE